MSYANEYYGTLQVEGLTQSEIIALLEKSYEDYASWLPQRVNDDCTIDMRNYCEYDDWNWNYDIRTLAKEITRAGGSLEGTVYRDGEESGDHEKIVVSDGGYKIENIDGRQW